MGDLWHGLSQLCGWVYFVLWSLSFYPQPLLNIKNRSTNGLAFDFPLLNTLGFICYTIGTAVFLYSPTIREQYAARHPASPEPTVQFNDLCFGINAVVFCAISVSQFWPPLWGFKHSTNRRANIVTWSIVCASFLTIACSAIMVLVSQESMDTGGHEWEWIDVVRHVSVFGIGHY
ncbi:uncharacterized protein RCC_04546 [Ramularia collo-cygni]|uniref:Uncharacterized protein n=1 Tax=Ramularia collo-cygni TaxID=112498 RepID=A0A2D3UPW3_9PEZI|nr:uncharacterized protein RCC_04546 [Ramularia collo-cygni]CZT18702.1 uncharacterized protein RCC_04546 [Ramularia collo-cygni]